MPAAMCTTLQAFVGDILANFSYRFCRCARKLCNLDSSLQLLNHGNKASSVVPSTRIGEAREVPRVAKDVDGSEAGLYLVSHIPQLDKNYQKDAFFRSVRHVRHSHMRRNLTLRRTHAVVGMSGVYTYCFSVKPILVMTLHLSCSCWVTGCMLTSFLSLNLRRLPLPVPKVSHFGLTSSLAASPPAATR